MSLPKEITDYIQERVSCLPDGCGNITIKVTRSGYMDVEVSESKRFPMKGNPMAGQVVGGNRIIVRKNVKRLDKEND